MDKSKSELAKVNQETWLKNWLVHDNTMNLQPLWFNAVAIVAFLQIMWIVFRHACFVSWTAKTAAVFQRRRLIQVELAFEVHV